MRHLLMLRNSHRIPILWNEQLKYNSLKDKRQMRWDPLLIRFALSIKYASSAAYQQATKLGFLALPSERTLRDYTHWCPRYLSMLVICSIIMVCKTIIFCQFLTTVAARRLCRVFQRVEKRCRSCSNIKERAMFEQANSSRNRNHRQLYFTDKCINIMVLLSFQ